MDLSAESDSMAEDQKNKKRQVAYKILIKDINSGEYVKGEDWNPTYLVLKNEKHISRVNLVAIVINKQYEGDMSYSNLTVDDGSGQISLRTFDNNINLNNFNIGDSVLIIGRPREFGNERYIVPEIIKKIDNKEWIDLRKAELNKEMKKDAPNLEVYELHEETVIENPDIFKIIRDLDKGDGADFNEVIEKSRNKDTEKVLSNMIKIGELFEIKPGKIKILE